MAVNASTKLVKPEDLNTSRLPPITRRAFLDCMQLRFFQKFPWYLAGGTALTLQVGHRQSIDLDFFTAHNAFDELALERQLLKTGKWTTSLRQDGTLYGVFKKAKMSFIAYPFFRPSSEYLL